MKHPIVQTLLAGGTSTILHILLFLLLIFSFDMPTDIRQFGQPEVEIVQATVVDEDLVLEEMARLQEAEEKKRAAEEERQQKLDEQLEKTQDELARKEQEFLDMQERAKLDAEKLKQEAELEQQRLKELEQQRI